MTKKTRLTILLGCVLCFAAASPFMVLYSMGYRFDFDALKMVATGGIYVRTFPAADQITIDSKITHKPGIFNNSVFTQSLMPKNHSVLIKKEGYFDYSKTLLVKEKEVAKLENVLLFRNDIKFEEIEDKTLSPFASKTKEQAPALKGLVSYAVLDNGIIWLKSDGFIYMADAKGKTSTKLNLSESADGKIKGFKISPDKKNIAYFTRQEISVALLSDPLNEKATLRRSDKDIINCLWLNNDYIIFNTTDKIIISEIDARGNINAVTLDQPADKIFFNSQDSKLYILNKGALLASDRLVP